MNREYHDRLIDQLLREMLGGDRPRDMTARVLAQAKIIDRFRRRIWLGGGAAIAAAIAVVAGLFMYWPHEYPNPIADDQVQVAEGGRVERGATLFTDSTQGDLSLGGYVDVKMSPQTQLNLGGSRYQEKVMLSQGELDVDVTKHKGQFDVAVGPTTVHVTGTKFRVRVGEENTPTAYLKKLYLAVKEGSVEVQNVPGEGTQTVTGGQTKSFTLASVSKSLSAGLLASAQQGAQFGARAGRASVVLPRVPPVASFVPPVQQEPSLPPLTPETGATSRPVQLQTTPASANRIGRVLHTGTVYYLESKDGNFLMFERSTVAATHPDWVNVPADQYTRVVWAEGYVSRMEKYVPAATQGK